MKNARILAVLLMASLYGLWGVTWGLPSEQRAAMVLSPSQRTPEFYERIEKARDDLYKKVGGNVVAYFGRTLAPGDPVQSPVTLMNSYSSFLIKTHELDEAATLVMVSRLNPLKNRWFPHAFLYGGAYLFPLAGYLAALNLTGLIHLLPSASYYYAHPGAIARIYVAIRLWALGGLLGAILAVYALGCEIRDKTVGWWAAWFFALAPSCMAFAKVAKPHTWAAAWTLWGLVFCLRAKKSAGLNNLIWAGLCWGIGLGSAITQVIFAPFFIWACWSSDRRQTLRRAAALGLAAGGVFFLSNIYLFAHFQEYMDEQTFLRRHSPFGLRPIAIWEYLKGSLRFALGNELWVLAMAGFVWSLWQKRSAVLRSLALLSAVTFVYTAFQMQEQHGVPSLGRYFIALGGICSLMAALVTYEVRWGPALRWGLLMALLVKAGIYAENFRSDRMPHDNASQAALWVKAHVPENSAILYGTLVPQTDTFPPLEFSHYRLMSLMQVDPDKLDGPVYGIARGDDVEAETRLLLVGHGFRTLARFADSPLQRLGYSDPFTQANFPVQIYIRDAPPRP